MYYTSVDSAMTVVVCVDEQRMNWTWIDLLVMLYMLPMLVTLSMLTSHDVCHHALMSILNNSNPSHTLTTNKLFPLCILPCRHLSYILIIGATFSCDLPLYFCNLW